MREPAFWWRKGGTTASLLAPLAAAYGAIAARRMRERGRDLDIPVLCVGNPTVGGAGKTPTALALGRMLRERGERPFFLSRGYGGRARGPVQVDPVQHRAVDVGDEPLLLARCAPTVVAHDRVAGARLARGAGARIIIMDDGFQNPSLIKDCSILVVDGRRGIGNGKVIPAGPLRAPLDPQIERADAMLVIGDVSEAAGIIQRAADHRVPIFYGRLQPDMAAIAALTGRRLLAFAGIGDPDKFFATLKAAGLDVRVRRSFPDHHRYRPDEAAALIARAGSEGLSLVTTEKDSIRLDGDEELAALAERAHALPVTLVLDEERAFQRLVMDRLKRAAAGQFAQRLRSPM
jgi:tetraacyldisaccharide 4'-kinase